MFCTPAIGRLLSPLLFFFSIALAQPNRAVVPAIDWKGTSVFRDLTYPKIIDSLLKHPDNRDSASWLFRLGTAYLLSGDGDKALPCFAGAPLRDVALSPLAWEGIGDCFARTMRCDSALACYERIVAMPLPFRYRATVYRKIRDIVLDDTARIRTDSLRRQYCRWWNAHKPLPLDPLCGRIDTLVRLGEWSQVNHLVLGAITALEDSSQIAIVKSIENGNPSDAALTTACLFLIARIAIDCRLYPIAEHMLDETCNRKDFDQVVGIQKYLKFRGRLFFCEGKNEEAIESLTSYIRRFGYEADVGFLVARAYRMLDNLDSSAQWYDRFIEASPRYGGMAEILWRRAWIEVERGDPDTASQFFRKIYQSYPRSTHAEEALLHHALCSFEEGKYDSVIRELASLETKCRASALLPAALFWKGKAWLRLDSLDRARAAFAEAVAFDPYDYYAHRSRSLLAVLHDSTHALFPLDTVSDTGRAIRWFDSLSPPCARTLTFEDSINLRRATVSATIGRTLDAETFFEPVEQALKGSPSLVFRMAMLYQSVGATMQGVRAGCRILTRLPAESGQSLPLPVRALLFPTPWADIVKAESRRWDIDPSLTYAVIRQESMFDPEAVSSAGAIGLMQIMPATGKTIAREIGEPFSIETLYTPEGSIRYGTYYLHKLLKEFDSNCEITLAGYNGGPPNAKEWLEHGKNKDSDLVVEGIMFSETRNYVKRVMANYWSYSLLMH